MGYAAKTNADIYIQIVCEVKHGWKKKKWSSDVGRLFVISDKAFVLYAWYAE